MTTLHDQIMNLSTIVPSDISEVSCSMADKLGHRDARHAAAELAIQQVPQWIKVCERRPEIGQSVLLSQTGTITEAQYRAGDMWGNDNWHRDVNVGEDDFWMPFPSAPNGKE